MADGSENIRFHYLISPFPFRNRTGLKRFLFDRIENHGRSVDAINFIFCDDAQLLPMNKEYLNHDTLTDIITFQLSEPHLPLLADIYISVERVRENAVEHRSSFKDELHRVIFHGVLHLLGFNDKSPSDARKMRVAEAAWLAEYAVSRNTVSG